jgi:hypothetical protein
MINVDLPCESGRPRGVVGFFESIQDYSVVDDLLSAAREWLKSNGAGERIWGPMNFDIWHNYRFMTDGFGTEPFCGEPFNKPFYPEAFERNGFYPIHWWDTAFVEGQSRLKRMIARGEKRYRLLRNRGYRFEPINLRACDAEFERLYEITTSSFGDFVCYSPPDKSEFMNVARQSAAAMDPRLFVLVYNDLDDLAGFGVALPEMARGMRALGGRRSVWGAARFAYYKRRARILNFYLGGVTQEEIRRRSGLGRAGFYWVLNNAMKAGYESVLFSLRAAGNAAHALLGPEAPEPERKYALYEARL